MKPRGQLKMALKKNIAGTITSKKMILCGALRQTISTLQIENYLRRDKRSI